MPPTFSSAICSRVILLAQDGLGLVDGDGIAAAVERFDNVRRLAVDTEAEDAPAPAGLRAISAFPGPHHLAGLLLRAAGALRDSALVRTPAPGGARFRSFPPSYDRPPPSHAPDFAQGRDDRESQLDKSNRFP